VCSLSHGFFLRREIWMHGVVVRLLGLVKSLDYYTLLLLFYLSTFDSGRGDLEAIKHGYMAQGLRNEGTKVHGFLLDLPTGDVGLAK